MSKLEVVECWKCTDGQVFTDVKEANEHQAKIDFDNEYDSTSFNGIYAGRSGEVPATEVRDWLVDNKDFVQQFYNAMEGK